MNRVFPLAAALGLTAWAASPSRAADFAYGFDGCPAAPVLGPGGGTVDVEVYSTLTTTANAEAIGAEGWSWSLGVTGGTVAAVSVDGVVVSTIYGAIDPSPLDLKDADFVVAETATKGAVSGGISAIVLSQKPTHRYLHPTGTEKIAKIVLRVEVPSTDAGQEVVVRYEDGFASSGEPVDNRVTFQTKTVIPTGLGECRFTVKKGTPAFALGFEGLPDMVVGEPGDEKIFDVFATLTSVANGTVEGASFWSLSIGADQGAEITDISSDSLRVPTNRGLFALDLGTTHPQLATKGGRRGAVQDMTLSFGTKRFISVDTTVRIARLRVRFTVPDAGCLPPRLYFEDGFVGEGQPVENVVTVNGQTVHPDLGSASTLFDCGLPVLELGRPAALSLTAGSPAAKYKLRAGEGSMVEITLDCPDPAARVGTYVRWDGLPTRFVSDFAAEGPPAGRTLVELVIPAFYQGPSYVLVESNGPAPPQGQLTLTATEVPITITGVSTRSVGRDGDGTIGMGVTGTGFGPGTTFRLEMGPATIEPGPPAIVGPTRAEMVFATLSAAPGTYALTATAGGHTATYPGALAVEESRTGPSLVVRLTGLQRYRRNRTGSLDLLYENAGDEEMTAPLFLIVGPAGSELSLEGETITHGSTIQALGIHPDGIAGRLSPGGSGRIHIVFRGTVEGDGSFAVYYFTPGENPVVGWDVIGKPAGPSPEAWGRAWPELSLRMGETWARYHRSLAEIATRLARRGAPAFSAKELFRFATRQAFGRPSSAVVGRVLDPKTFRPRTGVEVAAASAGATASTAVTDRNGSYCIDWLSAGTRYDILAGGTVSASVAFDASGEDVLGLQVAAAVAPGGGEAGIDPGTEVGPDESDLPDEPILPPRDLFTPLTERKVKVITSNDPNEKDGNGEEGTGDEVPAGVAITYMVKFENIKTSEYTAWAQEVQVTDTLDPRLLNLATFAPHEVAVGNRPPIFSRDGGYGTFGGYGQNGDLFLSIGCDLDRHTGRVTWDFKTVVPDPDPSNPSGYRMPDDHEAGFLPPEDQDPQKRTGDGQGHLIFTVMPWQDLADGADIPNQAEVTFDGNLPANPTKQVMLHFATGATGDRPSSISGSPRDGALVPAEKVTLTWSGLPDVVRYEVSVCRESGDDCRSLETAATEWTIESLEYETGYLWTVKAVFRSGNTLESADLHFGTLPSQQPPPPPTLRLQDDAPGMRLAVSWDPVPGADSYDVVLYDLTAGRQSCGGAGMKGTAFRAPAPAKLDHKYRWEVTARNRGGGATAVAVVPSFRRGDASSDGAVDMSDAIFILSHMFLGGEAPSCPDAADADDNGAIELTDAIFILGYLFLGTDKPPSPGPESCGPDPSELPDDLGRCADQCP